MHPNIESWLAPNDLEPVGLSTAITPEIAGYNLSIRGIELPDERRLATGAETMDGTNVEDALRLSLKLETEVEGRTGRILR